MVQWLGSVMKTLILITLLAIGCAEKEPHTCPEPTPMPVADRQRWLRDAGYYTYRIDGICGQRTHDAQLAWEKQDITDSAIVWIKKAGQE